MRACGYSLVEVVAASGIVAATLVPALELMRDGITMSQDTSRRQLLASYGVSQIEQRLCLTAATWTSGTFTGDYASDGHADVRFETICSDDPSDGGISGELMDLRTTVYYDADGDNALDAGELSCSFRTKLGRFATYEALIP